MSPTTFPILSTTIQERHLALERIVEISLLHSHSVSEASTKSSKCLLIFLSLLDVVFGRVKKRGSQRGKPHGSMCDDTEGVGEGYIGQKRMMLRSKM